MKHIGFAKMLGLRRKFLGIPVAFPPRISIVTVVQLGFFIGVPPKFFYFIGVLLVIYSMNSTENSIRKSTESSKKNYTANSCRSSTQNVYTSFTKNASRSSPGVSKPRRLSENFSGMPPVVYHDISPILFQELLKQPSETSSRVSP